MRGAADPKILFLTTAVASASRVPAAAVVIAAIGAVLVVKASADPDPREAPRVADL